MLILRQSTLVVISFGPFLDKTDGVTLETGLASALDHITTGILISKNGGTLAIRNAIVGSPSIASTYDAFGNYKVTLDATDTNTVGTLRMQYSDAATCLPVWQDFMIGPLPANVTEIADSTSAATHLKDHSVTAVPVTFTSGGSSTTAVLVNVDGAAASSTDDFYNGRVLIFTAPSGLQYQATDITDYVGSTKTATITQVTTAPGATTTAIMV